MSVKEKLYRAKRCTVKTIKRIYEDYFTAKGTYTSLLPDRIYLKQQYRMTFGKDLDLKHPQTFNEKLQWLKLHDRQNVYTDMVDKYEAKRYAARIMGEEHIIPTLGVWKSFDEIDFDSLPRQFVLKCTHDSGGLVICRDKATLDVDKAREIIEHCLKRRFFKLNREWPYKNLKPRIIAEQYMEDESGQSLMDYKFYCFNGEPKFLYISQGLEDHSTAQISFVHLDWTFAPYQRADFRPFDELPPKPSRFSEMVEFARKLSEGHAFLRVDLYQINGQIYFSEFTFYPSAGHMPFRDPAHDLEMGQMLNITNVGKKVQGKV